MTDTFDPKERARRKAAARRADARALSSGAITPHALSRRNGFLSAVNFDKVKVVGIGGKPIAPRKSDRALGD